MTTGVHVGVALISALMLSRAMQQIWVTEVAADTFVYDSLRFALPAFGAIASLVAVLVGRATGQTRRALALDALSIVGGFWIVLVISFGFLAAPGTGVLFALFLAARFAPTVCLLRVLWPGSPRRASIFSSTNWPPRYALAVGALLLITFLAVGQEWVTAASPDPVQVSLLRKWLPISLGSFAVATAAICAFLDPIARGSVLSRSLLFFSAVPLMLLLLRVSPGVLSGQLGASYATLILAFALHALHALWQLLSRLGDRQVAFGLAGIALVAFLAVLPYHRTVMPTASDEPHYLLMVQSLVFDGDLNLQNDYAGNRYGDFYPDRLNEVHGIHVGEAVYPIRDLGLPIISAPPYAVGGRTGVLALMCLIGALLVYQLHRLLRDLNFPPVIAFLTIAITAFTHPILVYTTQIYPELALALIFVLIARILRRGSALRPRDLALASALTGLLPLLSTRAWLIAVGVGIAIAFWASRARGGTLIGRLAAGLLPVVAVIGLIAFANWLMFGFFIPSAGYYLIRDQQEVLAFRPHVGALGLLFDEVFGLIPRAPIYLLAFLGLGLLWKRARNGHGAQLGVLALGWGAYFLYISSIAYWWADGSPPSRYLLASIPLLVVGVAAGLETIATWRLRALLDMQGALTTRLAGPATFIAAGLAAAAVFVTLVYTALPNLRYDLAVDVRANDSSGQLWTFVGRAIRPEPGEAFPSLVKLDPPILALAALWVAIALALVYLGARRHGSPREPLA